MRVWQVAAGDPGRDYSRLFFEHDVMLLGPGTPGDILDQASDYSFLSSMKSGAMRKMASKVQPGDVVIMRVGPKAVGIGIVPEGQDHGYRHDNNYDDIHGWELQHMRRVCWHRITDLETGGTAWASKLFQGRWGMFNRLHKAAMLDRIQPLVEQAEHRALKSLPESVGPVLEDDKIGELLFSRGLSQDNVDALLNTIARQRRLLRWYREHGEESDRPKEHEVVAYMALPMLLALGWSEQLLAIEWKKVDLAAFRRTSTTADRCVLVCEAKAMRSGLQGGAYPQAQNYTKKLKLKHCNHILLTQGQRFYLYRRPQGGDWPAEPTGYLNLLKIRERNLVPSGTNAIDTLMAMTPQAILGGQGL
jgi:transposase